jgi:FtsP/CotA-like multicopper oxidase with cupredoxin domain
MTEPDRTAQDLFTTDTTGLVDASGPEVVRLHDGARYHLRIAAVRKRVNDAEMRMFGYNGSIPGPTLVVDQASEITIEATNEIEVDTTVHWHGLRLQNRFDGVPGETQEPIKTGESFSYELEFPDPGIYWYHPHIREDFAQEMGLSGAIIVEPAASDYWPWADRQIAVVLDDVLIEGGQLAPFHRSGPTFTAMGRFGNVLLINGDTEFSGEAAEGEVVRLHLVNVANTRIFNLAIRGARMKLVGGDSGRYEREELVDEVLLSPSERATIDVLFGNPGEVHLEHRTPDRTYDLGSFRVLPGKQGAAPEEFYDLRVDPELAGKRKALAPDLEREPDKVLAMVSQMPTLVGEEGHESGHDHGGHEEGDGLEWEDLMPEINRQTNLSNMVWQLVDRETGAENAEISWAFKVGDRVKIRVVNEMDQDHPMHHPFHIHGAGRFLILARDGQPEENFVWKDTVLIRAGATVDLLLDVTNPGRWMAHCHIAEHTESGMMFSFDVAPAAPTRKV